MIPRSVSMVNIGDMNDRGVSGLTTTRCKYPHDCRKKQRCVHTWSYFMWSIQGTTSNDLLFFLIAHATMSILNLVGVVVAGIIYGCKVVMVKHGYLVLCRNILYSCHLHCQGHCFPSRSEPTNRRCPYSESQHGSPKQLVCLPAFLGCSLIAAQHFCRLCL